MCAMSPERFETGEEPIDSNEWKDPKVQHSEFSALIVDCGSSSTRAKVFIRKTDGIIIEVGAATYGGLPAWKEAAIVAILQEGSSAVRRWVEEVRSLAEKCGCQRIIIGATGGLRSARRDGKVSHVMVDDLREALKEALPAAVFKELSETDEAGAELSAVQYVASLGLPSDAPQPIGLISGGGCTIQVAYYTDAKSSPSFECIEANMMSACDAMVKEKVAVESVLDEFQDRLARLVEDTGLLGKLQGTICVIEMLGYMGDSTTTMTELTALNLGERLLTKTEIVKTLQMHLQDWLPRNEFVPNNDAAYTGLLPKTLIGMLDLVDDDARIYICRQWAVGSQDKIKPGWCLGMFVAGGECLSQLNEEKQ